jgi:L,D-transpeptidase ErfK/SrfK
MNHCRRVNGPLLLALCLLAAPLQAARYALPANGDDLIGHPLLVKASRSETLLDIARAHGLGQEEIRIANPEVDRWLPREGDPVWIPTQFILPEARREGLVLNLPEMRVYHFPRAADDAEPVVDTYPASVGRMDWKTPLGQTRVIRKQRDPSWYPPASVKQEAAAAGDSVPDVVPPGPDNPLGAYALRLGLPGYLIHGTNKPYGVGMRVTHGCVRLLPEDIEELFSRVPVGTPVQIVNQPVKTGWLDGVLYVEIHPPLDEDDTAQTDLLRFTLEKVYAALEKRPAVLDGRALREAVAQPRGIPVAVSRSDAAGQPITHPWFQ